MDPWLERQSIAEDMTTWLTEYRDREVRVTPTPQGQGVVTTLMNGVIDYVNAMMFQAESKAKDAYQEKHCEPGSCCAEER